MNPLNNFRLGVAFAVTSAITFGVSGPFAKALMDTGWTPSAAVTVRMGGGALAMALFATIVHRHWFIEALAHGKTLVAYGLVPVAGAQLCFYNAVTHLSVGVALLIEYLAPVLVIGWAWATTCKRPGTLALIGTALAFAGATVVLDVFSDAEIDMVGVAWALSAAVCAACYFVLSERASSNEGLNPLTLATGGLIIGTISVAALGICGVLPMNFATNDTVIAGHTTSFLVPAVVLGVVATAMAYALGISGVAKLGPSYASLLGLGEVLSAVLWAWLLVSEKITPVQAIGGGVVLLGLALAGRNAERNDTEIISTPFREADDFVVEPHS